MPRKLSDEEVTELIHAMGEMLFTPDGTKYEAVTTFSQARLDTALKILLIASAGMQKKAPVELSVIEGGKD